MKKNKKTKITANTVLSEILKIPQGKEILWKYNVPCLSCPFAKMEMENLELKEICDRYEIDLGKILKDLNEVYSK